MENVKIYKELAKTAFSRLRCIGRINAFTPGKFTDSNIENWKSWVDKYDHEIDVIMEKYLPHGSGVDNGCTFNFEKSINNRLVINSGYHCMDQYGCYDRWVDFTVTLTPDLELDYTINIRGNFGKYGHIKDYLYQIFHESFDTEYKGDK